MISYSFFKTREAIFNGNRFRSPIVLCRTTKFGRSIFSNVHLLSNFLSIHINSDIIQFIPTKIG